MSQAYGRGFARAYNLRWAGFARQVAPHILDFYAATPAGESNKAVLDLCCGTGQLALFFLEHGYRVIGLDLSESMLDFARENAALYLVAGQARFIHADATGFTLDEQVGLAVSTFDALNHLASPEALKQCFRCVYPVISAGGWFVFDLNTRAGLSRWNSINVEDTEEALIVTRGIYDGQGDRAYTRVSGFVRAEGGAYERFDETVYNTVFDMEAVRLALLDAGWRSVHFARLPDLSRPLAEPEKEGRVFVVANK